MFFFIWAYHGKVQVCILPSVSQGTFTLLRYALLISFPYTIQAIYHTDNIAVIARTPSSLQFLPSDVAVEFQLSGLEISVGLDVANGRLWKGSYHSPYSF